jgi:hypothetical protein
MRTSIRSPLLAILLAALAACTGTGKNSPEPRAVATVRVENQAWLDMNVFVVEEGGSSRRRLGMVTGNTTSTFRLPAAVVGTGRQVRFLVDPVGSSSGAASWGMYVRPGERTTITIPPTVGR